MKISIIGSGLIGTTIATLLCNDPEVDAIALIDHNGNALSDAMSKFSNKKIKAHKVDIDHYDDISAIISQTHCIISALPPHQNWKITRLALKLGLNYIDLGGSDSTLERQLLLNEQAIEKKCWLVPNSGFAPGLANIVAMQTLKELDETDSVTIYGGGLPINPEPPFYFQMNFSPIGLIKEYVEPATIIKDGAIIKVDALSDYSETEMDINGNNIEFESFIVSSRISSLAKLMQGKVKNLSYKVLRYKGHKNLLEVFSSLGFLSNRLIDVRTSLTYQDLFIRQLTKYLPKGNPDFVHIQIETIGLKSGKKTKITYWLTEVFSNRYEHTALAHCSAASAIVTAKLLSTNQFRGLGGASAPEGVIPFDAFAEELKKYGLALHRKEEVID